MYIQITDRCNMMCDHCCFSCTEKGSDMSMEIFKECIDFASETWQNVSIGGGEPTLHPNFLEMLCYSISKEFEIPVWFATNGTNTQISKFALKLASSGVIGMRISLDQYHDLGMVNYEVIKSYEKLDRYARSENTIHPVAQGRALENFRINDLRQNDCVCDDLFIDPHGNVYLCGCKSQIIGTYKNLDVICDWLNNNQKDSPCQKNYESHEIQELVEEVKKYES